MATATQVESEQRAVGAIWWTLKVVFGLVPIVAGLDKFTNILVQWDKYIAPAFAQIIPMRPASFMYLVGVIEIIVGLGVLFSPWTRIFAFIAGIWLLCIALNLIVAGYYDIAVRDIVMAISSFCLARLTAVVPAEARMGRPAFRHA